MRRTSPWLPTDSPDSDDFRPAHPGVVDRDAVPRIDSLRMNRVIVESPCGVMTFNSDPPMTRPRHRRRAPRSVVVVYPKFVLHRHLGPTRRRIGSRTHCSATGRIYRIAGNRAPQRASSQPSALPLSTSRPPGSPLAGSRMLSSRRDPPATAPQLDLWISRSRARIGTSDSSTAHEPTLALTADGIRRRIPAESTSVPG